MMTRQSTWLTSHLFRVVLTRSGYLNETVCTNTLIMLFSLPSQYATYICSSRQITMTHQGRGNKM
ncbi:hypothetical protein HanRHA438_Chr00c07g0846521 [Helianthus annuus]|nr:hypothetical protein HanRHA438_Chr00c07g0846521 [Helianthus annuus]